MSKKPIFHHNFYLTPYRRNQIQVTHGLIPEFWNSSLEWTLDVTEQNLRDVINQNIPDTNETYDSFTIGTGFLLAKKTKIKMNGKFTFKENTNWQYILKVNWHLWIGNY